MKIFPGLHVKLTPLSNAELRTKNRIHERGSQGFIVKSVSQPVIGLDGRMGILFVAVDPSGKRGEQWMGWLPEYEIDISLWRDK